MITATQRLSADLQSALEQAEDAAQSLFGANIVLGASPRDFLDSARRCARVLAVNPRIVAKKHLQLGGELARILVGSSRIQPPPKDLRFKHPVWRSSPYYRRVMQAYLVWRKSLFDILASANADERDKERAKFILMQITAAAAPTNNPLGNPGFVDSLVKTRGKSLFRGAHNLLHDIQYNNAMPRQVDKDAFSVGRDLAVSPGAVVFRNEVCEIIQYQPTTPKVYPKPVLIVPPQINKFYLVDLAPDKSYVKYATEKGLQVFVISWRNPTVEHRDWNLGTYVDAVINAVDVVRDISGQESINLMGACAGGITSIAALAYMDTLGTQGKVDKLSLLVTLVDVSLPTLIGLFASDTTLNASRQMVQKRGYIDGAEMGRMFAWLRPADLVWLFFANNYVMGNNPPAFDFLYWNNDSTRLPAGFHGDCIDLFASNPLMGHGGLKVKGVEVNPRKVNRDAFIVSGVKDHIVPWRSSYAATQVLSGKKHFVLGTAGHIQAVVSPPGKKRAGYYVNEECGPDADAWLHNASLRQGTWWDEWFAWITDNQASNKTARKTLGNRNYPAGDLAPGRYVFD